MGSNQRIGGWKKAENTQSKQQKKNEDSLWSLWDNFKHGNIYIMGVLEGEETEIMELTIYLKNKQRFHSYFCSPFFPNLLPNITHCPPYVLLSVCKDEASGSQEQILSDGLVPFSSTLTTNCLPLFQPVSYTHLTLPTRRDSCRSRWSPYH